MAYLKRKQIRVSINNRKGCMYCSRVYFQKVPSGKGFLVQKLCDVVNHRIKLTHTPSNRGILFLLEAAITATYLTGAHYIVEVAEFWF